LSPLFQQRNKPKQPPKAPKAAPFFLPTIAGLEPKFDIQPEEKGKKKVCTYGQEICCRK